MEKDIPYVFVTSDVGQVIPPRFRKAPIFEKPFHARTVAKTILRLCAKRWNKAEQNLLWVIDQHAIRALVHDIG
jgi:hypothetical protein